MLIICSFFHSSPLCNKVAAQFTCLTRETEDVKNNIYQVVFNQHDCDLIIHIQKNSESAEERLV